MSRRLLLQASATEINDVQWCPTNSTVFGSVTSNGRLEVRARARPGVTVLRLCTGSHFGLWHGARHLRQGWYAYLAASRQPTMAKIGMRVP